MKPLGLIGLGSMGGNYAATLARGGIDVLATDLSPERRAEAVANGAREASDIKAVCAECDIIMLSLPEAKDVRLVVEEQGGILDFARPGTIILDTTTSDAETSRALAEKLAGMGHAFLDTPVSGGPMGAAAGTLAIMVGGDADALERARPYLEVMAGNLVHAGPSGAGNVVKLVNNLMGATNALIAAEGLRLCERAGVDADALLNVVNTASGRSFMSEVVLTKLLEGDRKDAGFGFSAKLMRKDVRLALEMATATETEMPLSQLSGRVWAESHDHVTDDQDFSALAGAILAKGKLI